ncbi:MAG: GntR family transcriptional regulator [Thermoguttaceae bacterium]
MARSLAQLAYQRIRQRLLASDFPVDQRISETVLASQLGISRTPVREAIRRLQSEGLLCQVPRSGTFVVRLDRSEIIEVYEVRRALECLAVRTAARQMAAKDCDKLQMLADEMLAAIKTMRDAGHEVLGGEPLQRYLKADLAFHMLLLQAGGNRMATKIVADARIRDSVFGQRTHHRTLHHVAWVWLVHARIARAVRRRDPQAAHHWLHRHIRASMRDALAAFDNRSGVGSQEAVPAAPAPQSVEELVGTILSSFSGCPDDSDS